MTAEDRTNRDHGTSAALIESRVRAKFAGRLEGFHVDWEDDQLVLGGVARSHYVKQLAQREVMSLTDRPILHNRIRVPHELARQE